MSFGLLAGVLWALGTVVLGIALSSSPLSVNGETLFLAPFVATFLHDAASAVFALIYNLVKGNAKRLILTFKSKKLIFLIIASAIGGPVGMTGYVLAVNFLGASVGAVASAIYPAIGTLLAFIFLKERVKPYQWVFLGIALLGVYGLSFSPTLTVTSFPLGLVGAAMCAIGWGVEAVVLAKCFTDPKIKQECALFVRQTVSATVYGALIIPILGGYGLVGELFTPKGAALLPIIAAAALCSTLSYLFYYLAISRLGASKAMALNITYTAWAIIFTLIILRDFSVLNPITLLCSAAVVIFGILAATDIGALIRRGQK